MKKKAQKRRKLIRGLAIGATVIVLGALCIGLYWAKQAKAGSNPSSSEAGADQSPVRQITAKQARLCKPVSDPKNACSPANLASSFPDPAIAVQASSICNLESQGNPDEQSYVDFCRDGTSYSYGLFQINVIAKANLIPECQGAFQVTMNQAGDDIACLKEENGVCIVHDCRVIDQTKYQACKAAVTDIQRNINIAAQVYAKTNSWKDWGSYAFCKAKF